LPTKAVGLAYSNTYNRLYRKRRGEIILYRTRQRLVNQNSSWSTKRFETSSGHQDSAQDFFRSIILQNSISVATDFPDIPLKNRTRSATPIVSSSRS
jgi:hypothetical protein